MENYTARQLLVFLKEGVKNRLIESDSEIVTSYGVVSNFSVVDGFIVAKTDGEIMSIKEAIDRLEEFDNLLLADPVLVKGLFVRKLVMTDGSVCLIHEDDPEGKDDRVIPPSSTTTFTYTGGRLKDSLREIMYVEGYSDTPLMFRDNVVTEATIRGGFLVINTVEPSTSTIFLTVRDLATFLGNFHQLAENLLIMIQGQGIDGVVVGGVKAENYRFYLVES